MKRGRKIKYEWEKAQFYNLLDAPYQFRLTNKGLKVTTLGGKNYYCYRKKCINYYKKLFAKTTKKFKRKPKAWDYATGKEIKL